MSITIGIACAYAFPEAEVVLGDLSFEALEVANQNIERHGLEERVYTVQGDGFDGLPGQRFDLIVSNPPYVVDGDPHLAQNGLPFEPQTALTDGVAGGDGLDCIRAIVDGASAHLQPGGWLLMEHGYDQAVQVRELLAAAGFSDVASWRDSAAIERVSGGCLP